MSETNEMELPLVCHQTAMAPEQRGRYETQKARLRANIHEVEALADGYAFHFQSVPGLLPAVAEFVEGERLCCPFFTFAIHAMPQGGEIVLRITGPAGTTEFVREALSEQVDAAGDLSTVNDVEMVSW